MKKVDLHHQSSSKSLSRHKEDVQIAGLTLFDMHRGPRKLFDDSTTAEDGSKVPATISVPDEVVESLFREDLKCGVCLGILDITLTITQCFHRFCSECLHRSLRMELGPKSHHECPSCRAKLASRRASKPDMKYDSLIRLISANGRKRSLSISPLDDDDDGSATATVAIKTTRTSGDDSSRVNPISRQPLRKDTAQPHRLDLEKYRIAHLEKVNEFRERQAKMLSIGSSTNHKSNKKASHKAKAGGSGYKGRDERHHHTGKASIVKGSHPIMETAAAAVASSPSHAKVWMSLFPLPEVSSDCTEWLVGQTQ